MQYNVAQQLVQFISCKALNTQLAYYSALKLLGLYFTLQPLTQQFTERILTMKAADCVDFICWMRSRIGIDGRPVGDNTVAQRIALLRCLFQHFVALEVLKSNPWYAASRVLPLRRRKQKRPTRMIEFNRVQELLNTPKPNTKSGIRDRAILSLFFGGGLRISEIYNLNVDDVYTTPSGVPYLLIKDAKSGGDQKQSLPRWAWERFSVLVSQRKNEQAAWGDPLFVFYYKNGTARKRLSIESIRRHYKKYCKAIGIDRAAPHGARATAASYLKYKHIEDRDVAQFLRHGDDQMVRVYDKRTRGVEQNPGRALRYPKKGRKSG